MSALHFSPNAECGGKRPFANKTAAKRAIRSLERARGVRLEAYRCGVCDSFHLGHRPTAEAKSRIVPCAGCGRPWRPRVRVDRDGTVIWARDADPSRCTRCQPVSAPVEAVG